MAYRFLLEVPDALYEEANVVLTATPDADIVDVHQSHGTGFDTPSLDITMVAYSLDVVSRVSSWYDQVKSVDPNAMPVTVALTNGTRLPFGDVPNTEIVAAIRRDQPWIERFIPKIGEHHTTNIPYRQIEDDSLEIIRDETRGAPHMAKVTIIATDEPEEHPTIDIDDARLLRLEVIDVANPERDYGEVLGAALIGRADRKPTGGWTFFGPTYDVEQEAQFGTEPDFAFVQNGPLSIALERMGRAYPLKVFSVPPKPVRLLVDDASFDTIKAQVLVRNWNVTDDKTEGVFGFRDPYGYTWAIHSETFEKGAPTNA